MVITILRYLLIWDDLIMTEQMFGINWDDRSRIIILLIGNKYVIVCY